MKKILILAYDFPPYVSVGGLRPNYWMKNFHKHGIHPVVVTRKWAEQLDKPEINYISSSNTSVVEIEKTNEYTLIEAPYKPSLANKLMLKYGKERFKLLRRSLSFFNEIFQFVLPIGTKRSIFLAADDYLKNNKVDCIIATADPFVLFHYANKLSVKYKIPWIADYRDPWSQDMSLKDQFILKKTYGKLEQKIVKNANCITVSNEHFKETISTKFINKEIHVISNGFSFSEDEVILKQTSKNLTISFVGTIYEWHPIEQFLSALEHVIVHHQKNIYLKLYGINNANQISNILRIKFPSLQKHVSIVPRMSHHLLMKALQQDNVMLAFNYYSLPGTKIYDYLSVKRKIILCFTDENEANKLRDKYLPKEIIESNINPQIDILNNTKSGVAIKDQKELIQELLNLTKEFENNGLIFCKTQNIEQYSRENQLKKLVSILHGITKQSKNILILAYDFPPYVSVAALRPFFWMQNFHEYEIYPIIVSRKWGKQTNNPTINYITPSPTQKTEITKNEKYTLIEAPYFASFSNKLMLKYGEHKYVFIRKLFSLINELLQYFTLTGTKTTIFKAASDYLKNEKVHFIIATGDPFVLFHYANKLSKRYNIPWIADYRDPWSQDISLKKKILLKSIYRSLEKRIVENATFITTVDTYCLNLLHQKFPHKKIEVIRNGYDSNLVALEIEQEKNRMSIAFVGTLYKWHPIDLIFETLMHVNEKVNFEIDFNLYGINNEQAIKELIDKKYAPLKPYIHIFPKMNNSKLMYELMKNNLMLLFNDYSITGTKIFDYIGIKRKILFCFTDDLKAKQLKNSFYYSERTHQQELRPQLNILDYTQSGIPIKNQEELADTLLNLYSIFKSKGEIPCDSINIEEFSRNKELEKLIYYIEKYMTHD